MKKKGFTLIELIVSMGILAIIVATVAGMENFTSGRLKSSQLKIVNDTLRSTLEVIGQKMYSANDTVTMGGTVVYGFRYYRSVSPTVAPSASNVPDMLVIVSSNASTTKTCTYFGLYDSSLRIYQEPCVNFRTLGDLNTLGGFVNSTAAYRPTTNSMTPERVKISDFIIEWTKSTMMTSATTTDFIPKVNITLKAYDATDVSGVAGTTGARAALSTTFTMDGENVHYLKSTSSVYDSSSTVDAATVETGGGDPPPPPPPPPPTTVSTPYIWVASWGELAKMDTTTGSIACTTTSVGMPYGVAVDNAGYVWLSDTSGTIYKITASNCAVSTSFSSGGTTPQGIAVDGSGNVWVANSASNNVKKFSSSGTVLSTTNVGTAPTGIAIDSSGNAWVANKGSSNVTKITGSNGVVASTTTVGTSPAGVAFDGNGNIWVANTGNSTVSKISIATGNVIGTANIGAIVTDGITVDSLGNVWAASTTLVKKVFKIRASDAVKIGEVSVAGGSTGIAADNSGFVWSRNASSLLIDGAISKINASTNVIASTPSYAGSQNSSYGDMTGFALQKFVLGL